MTTTSTDHYAGGGTVLLLSGGLDSAALAALERPTLCLSINYGQRPAPAELRAAATIADQLNLKLATLTIDLGGLGGGLLLDETPLVGAPSPEWWPYRNQLLVTIAAGFAVQRQMDTVIIGTVAGDGTRHVDGTPAFYEQLDRVVRMQEGNVSVRTPAIGETTTELVLRSGLGLDVLGWTVSCHRAALPCGNCPGCFKRTSVLTELRLLPEDL